MVGGVVGLIVSAGIFMMLVLMGATRKDKSVDRDIEAMREARQWKMTRKERRQYRKWCRKCGRDPLSPVTRRAWRELGRWGER